MQTIFRKSIHLLAAVNWKENQKITEYSKNCSLGVISFIFLFKNFSNYKNSVAFFVAKKLYFSSTETISEMPTLKYFLLGRSVLLYSTLVQYLNCS